MGFGGLTFLFFSLFRPQRHHDHFYGPGRGAMGLFTGCGFACAGLVVLSSAVFAGIRRVTGLTFRRQLRCPLIDPVSGEKWLRWYDSRLVEINEKAEQRIAATIKKFGGDIESPAIRELWEKQLREDVKEKVDRLKGRRECLVNMIAQAKEAKENPTSEKHKKHWPLLAVYLYIGEWTFDWFVSRMKASKHFCYENGESPLHLDGSDSHGRYHRGRGRGRGYSRTGDSMVDAGFLPDSDLFLHYFPETPDEDPGFAARARSYPSMQAGPSSSSMSSNMRRSPNVYIASAMPPATATHHVAPVPSAPEINEDELAKILPPLPAAPAFFLEPSAPMLTNAEAVQTSAVPSSSRPIQNTHLQRQHELYAPPPYTPVEESTQ